jgi:iron complex outermembrane receptor protein
VVDFTSPTLVSVQPVTPYNGNNAPQRQHQWSEELQLIGKTGDFNYLLGGYYFHENSSEANHQALTFVLPVAALPYAGFPQDVANTIAALNPGLNTVGVNLTPFQAFSGTAESVAAFGQVSWKPAALSEKLEVTVGGRYTSDKKTILLAGDVVPTQSGRTKFDNVSWLGSLSYKVSPGVLVYARASSGYRSGGINPRTAVINTFAPEKARSYEAGLKSDFLDNHLRVNLAGYVTDYSNLQVQQFAAGTGGATSLIVNAGKVRLSGFEAEVVAAPLHGLTFDGSVGYVHTKYKTFLFRDPYTNAVTDVASIARPVYSPTWTAHIGGEYVAPVGDASVRLRVDYSYAAKMYFNALSATAPFNDQILAPANHNLKARVSFEDIRMGASKLDLGFWGDNLTNTRPIVYGIDFGSLGFAGANFKKPTSWGVDARISF